MGLIDLISNLDSSTKTRLLGEKITKILRYTFAMSDYDAVDDEIINEALALQKGEELVRKHRELLIESCRIRELKLRGFDSHDLAISTYLNDKERFVKDFTIEEEYLLSPIEDRRTNTEIIIPKYGDCNGINAFPHDYQLRLKRKIFFLLVQSVNPIILASMPTGAGKTVLAMEIIVDLIRSYSSIHKNRINIIWIVNSKELCEQSLRSFQKLWKQKGDQKVIAERFFSKFDTICKIDNSSKITFATFDLVTSRKNSNEVQTLLKNCDALFIDEAHSSDAHTYGEILHLYKRLNETHKIVGLTATPYRTQDNEFNTLKDLFKDYLTLTNEQDKPVNSPLQYLMDRQFLAKICFEVLNVSEGEVSMSEYYRTLHQSVLFECQRLIEIGKNTIIFAQSKAHAIAISIFLKKNEIDNGLIVGETPDQKREELLKNFGDKNENLSVLVNHQILSTGIDVPGMNSIMVLAEINSPSLALQILGRAMRGPKNGGNEENTIFLTPKNKQRLKEYKLLESIVLN